MVLFNSLIIAHLLVDFAQPGWMVKWSKQSSLGLFVHAFSYTMLSAVILFDYPFWWLWVLILGTTHFLVDKTKYYFSPRLPGWEMPLFIIDQLIHAIIVFSVTFISGLSILPVTKSSIFIQEIMSYKIYLPYIVGYLIATFSISILIFEIDRTITVRRGTASRRVIITFFERSLGMAERGLALMLLLINNFFILFPFAFTISVIKLFKSKDSKQQQYIELIVGVLSCLIIAAFLRF